jgi:2-octaprenyl-6-methoxyphenol hydroxylase
MILKPSCVDIIIVGGGAVGTSLALALEKKASVALVDTLAPQDRANPEKDNRIFALAAGTQKILDKLGVWSSLEPLTTPIAHIHVSNRGSFGAARLHAQDVDLPALGYMCAAIDLQKNLQQRADQSASIRHIYPATCTSFHSNKESVEVKLNTGETLSGKILIATDGEHSMIRQTLGINSIQKDYQQTAIVAKIKLNISHQLTAYERFVDDTAIALLPYGQQTCALIWSIPSTEKSRLMNMSDPHFVRTLQENFGHRLGIFQEISPRFAYPLMQKKAERIHQDRIVLIGNAAQTLHPIAAQGFNLALRHVALFADIFSKSNSPESAIASYAQQQVNDTENTLLFTESLVRFFSNEGLGQSRVIRGGLLTAFDLCPPIKRRVLSTANQKRLAKIAEIR